MVSGRASFEIVQKALFARIPVVVAVSAASTLAVDLAPRGELNLNRFHAGTEYGGLQLSGANSPRVVRKQK